MSMPEFSPDYCPDCGRELNTKKVIGRERLWCGNCEQVQWLNPSICAGFIVKKGDKILLQKRNIEPKKGKWSIPAGFLELDETPLEAAKRELKEETGLEVEGEPEFIDCIQIEHPDGKRVIALEYYIDYEDTTGKLSLQEEEVQKLEFWDMDKIYEEKEKLDYTEILDSIEKIRK